MKIVSDFSDFYDGVSRGFYSDDILFIRKTSEAPKEIALYAQKYFNDLFPYSSLLSGKYDSNRSLILDCELILFCGKTYPYIRARQILPYVNKCFYSYASLLEYMRNDKQPIPSYLIKQITEFFFSFCKMDCMDLNVKFSTPIFKVTFDKTEESESNPNLRASEFFKAVDTYQVYQELSMFIGGILAKSENEMVKISDKDKLLQHGFDKQSFRHPVKLSQLAKSS